MNHQWKKYIPGCVAGNILELYEFIIYGYFASIIGKVFFPIQNQYTSLMAAFAIFATGSIVRPLSAVFFGYIGDKLGRRTSLIISIGIMAFSTFSIGILPTYDQIGLIAPVLLVLCRVGQGLSMSSEEIGAALYLIENAPINQKNYAGSLVLGSVYLGLLLGSAIATLIFSILNDKALLSFGWRLPFILGGSIGLITLIIRIRQPESYEFKSAKNKKVLCSNPLVSLFKSNVFSIIRITSLFCLMAVAIYLFAVYIPNTLTMNIVGISKRIVMLLCSVGFIIAFLVSLLTGKLADRIGPYRPLVLSSLGFLIFSYPIFALLSTQLVLYWLISYCCFSVLLGLTAGAIMLPAMKPFDIGVRFSGCCIAFNLSRDCR